MNKKQRLLQRSNLFIFCVPASSAPEELPV